MSSRRSTDACQLTLTQDRIRHQIYLNLMLAIAGLLAAIWTFIPHQFWHHLGYLPILFPAIYHLRYILKQRGGDEEAAEGKETLKENMRVLLLGIPLLLYFYSGKSEGIPVFFLLGTMIFFIGFVLFAPAVSDTRQRYLIGWAIAVMVAGLAIPVISPVPVSVDAVIGGALLIGGGLTAIMLSVTKGEYQRDRA